MQEHDSGRFVEQLCTRQSRNQTPCLESADLDSEKWQELLLRQLPELFAQGIWAVSKKRKRNKI